MLDDGVRARIDAEIEELLDGAVAFARASVAPDPADALDFVYASGLRPRDGVAS
jgi:pyruvate dehydrogenase E1 component alpha subunit